MGEQMRNVYLYPVFEDKASFDEVMSRAAWYFEPWLGDIKGFHIGASFDVDRAIARDPSLDPSVAAKAPALMSRAVIHNTSATTNAWLANDARKNAELLLIWKMPEEPQQRAQAQSLYEAVRARGWLSYVVDKDNEMSHGCNWLWSSITLATRDERERLKADSYAALMRFAAQVRSPRAYVLGTGPNLEQAAQRDFSDGDCIIANSIIKNRPLMERLNPIAVCACDPIFHAGVSLYAAEFRQTLIQAMDDFPRMYFFAPHRDEKIYLLNLPQRLHDRFIFVPIDTAPGVKWNFDLRRDFYLVPEGNVLTQMMLPIAAAFHGKLSVIGCDGRPLSQNTYFWSHHASSQFNDQMQNIQEVHPAFFKLRDYDDHYSEHCADTARIIANLEDAGKRVECLTDSYIPALRQRYSLDQRPLGDDVVVVSINPNLRNNYGHLLGYDEGLREAARASGAHFLTLGSKNFDGAHADLDGAEILIEPTFSDNVYAALTRKLPDVDQSAVLNFEHELESAVLRHKREHAGKRLAYYLYMGSLPHAVAVANVCARHPDISATVNTFGECIMDCMRGGHIDQWTDFLRSAAQQKNFAVLAITPQLKHDVRERCGVDLRLCPHPTAAFPDALFADWFAKLEREPLPSLPNRLVFPGGFWGEKNFDLTCDIARAAARTGYSCTVRTGPLESANSQQLEARRAIEPHARTADGVLGDDEYRALFQDADIAVLTYRRADWRMRNSSVVIDCLYAGLPMVVVSGTWLSDLVEQFGCGEIVEDETSSAFMAAVERIRGAYSTYRNRTIAAARAYQCGNSFAEVLAVAVSPLWADADEPLNPYEPAAIPAALDLVRAAAIAHRPARHEAPSESSPMPFDATNQESAPLTFALSRAANCMFEELSVARALLRGRDQSKCVMIDVGAHSGGSFPPFIDAGWTVHAFEPDPSNRAGIPKRYLDNPRFILDPRALSDKVQEDVAFFTSSESTGISGLTAFHNTHVETTRVSTTTLANVIADRAIDHITLLKVDTEGFDLFVLQGMAWDRVAPEVVITEYENNKTERLGYTFEDQIRLLESHGYTVFVSEWWPIVRYGIRHHWCSLYPAAQKRPPAASWGNLIAFKRPPPLKDIYRAMLEAVDLPGDADTLSQANAEFAALKARVDAMPDQIAPRQTAAPQRLTPTIPAPRAPGPLQWLRTRATPGRKMLARAAALGIVGALTLTAAAYWLWTNPGVGPTVRGALIGASIVAWIGILALSGAALLFLKRRAVARRLADAPALLNVLRAVNALQRRRRRDAIVSAGLLAGLALLAGATLGAGATGGLSPWVLAPTLVVIFAAASAVLALWGLALVMALIRSESEGVMARRYDRSLALVQNDIAAQARAHDAIQTEMSANLARTNSNIGKVEQSLFEAQGAIGERINEIAASLAAEGQSSLDAQGAIREKINEIAAIFAEERIETAQVQQAFIDAKKALTESVDRHVADLALETNKRFDRFRRTIAELDEEFRSEILARVHALRQDFEIGVRRRTDAAKAAAIQEAGDLIEAALARQSSAVMLAATEEAVDVAKAAERRMSAQLNSLRDGIDEAFRLHNNATKNATLVETANLVAEVEQRVAARLKNLGEIVDDALHQQTKTAQHVQDAAGLAKDVELRVSARMEALRESADQALQAQVSAAKTAVMEQAADMIAQSEQHVTASLGEVREIVASALQARAAAARRGALDEAAKLISEIERRAAERAEISRERLQTVLSEQVQAVKAIAEDGAANLRADSERLVSERLAELPQANTSRFLNFNRRLTDESVALLQHWATTLGVQRDSGALAYMAHRIEGMEAIARGRLAASAETQILRNLVALSARTEKFEALEIGTLYGLGAAALIETAATRFASARLTVIDPFEGYYGETHDPLLGLPITRAGFEANMRRLDIPPDAYRVIAGFSEKEDTIAAARGPGYNFLLIDGDHSYEGVRRDFENYAPMIKRYGYVLIDDYGVPEYDGIQRYVDETLKHHDRLQFVGAAFSTAVFRIWRKLEA